MTACSSSRRPAAGVAGLLAEVAQGERYDGKQVVVTVTGHGLKDIDTALSSFTDLVDTVVDADVDAAAAAAGAAMNLRSSVRSRSTVPATSANLGPGFDALGPRPGAARLCVARAWWPVAPC